MDQSVLSQSRLQNQQVLNPEYTTADELLHWMGAMQAQDYEMSKWALGVRLPGATVNSIERAIAKGEIIRTHILRPTWHYVAARDIRWIMELTAPRIRVAIRSRQKQLSLTKDSIQKSNRVIEEALSRNDRMTRSELVELLESAGLRNEDNRASHLLIAAELDCVICSGPSIEKNYTYTLFDKRIPPSPGINKDEALARLAKIYFQSHGPATLDDFAWWSGLTKIGAKKALNFIKSNLISEEIDSQIYWFFDPVNSSIQTDESVQLLPAYDEFLISYKNRNASIRVKDKEKAILNNGIFRPIIVVNGEVVGIWKRSIQKKTVLIESEFFNNPSKRTLILVEKAAKYFAAFLKKSLQINHVVS